ncbi:MAG TPA: type II toxin-antitoxin system RelE/ParE family toxin [Rhizomicrobium sp.]|nr:type II toxin-antitoxin system RelE/ParE family toxin [Rhizomicrobium sp.]
MIFEISKRARDDIENIAHYTFENFGLAQTEEYLDGLYRSFELLAENPKLGREWSAGRRRYIYRMHHVYYRITAKSVFVTHIRHSSQSPI